MTIAWVPELSNERLDEGEMRLNNIKHYDLSLCGVAFFVLPSLWWSSCLGAAPFLKAHLRHTQRGLKKKKKKPSAEQLMAARCKNRHIAEHLLCIAVNHGAITWEMSAVKTWALKIPPASALAVFCFSTQWAVHVQYLAFLPTQNHRCFKSFPTALHWWDHFKHTITRSFIYSPSIFSVGSSVTDSQELDSGSALGKCLQLFVLGDVCIV